MMIRATTNQPATLAIYAAIYIPLAALLLAAIVEAWMM
jgi:hypothetical protein